MRTALAAASLLLCAPFLGACSGDGDDTATDPGSSPTSSTPTSAGMPTEVPAAPGTVHTLNIATVMDTGHPELCLGPVAESWPPQCGGPAIRGWAWSDQQGMFESHQGTRWGQFAVSGTWNGDSLTLDGAIPAALYDAMPVQEPDRGTPAVQHSDAELEGIAEEVGRLPGAQGAYADRGQVLVDVLYDDGSLQAWADDTYGDQVVIVTSMLVDDQA